MTIKLCCSVIVLALLTTPALAGKQDKHEAKPDKNGKICRSELQTGSILQTRTCRTAAQWAQIDAERSSQASSLLDKAHRSYNEPQQ